MPNYLLLHRVQRLMRVHTTDFRPGLTYGPRPGIKIKHACERAFIEYGDGACVAQR